MNLPYSTLQQTSQEVIDTMASAITGTPYLVASPTGYAGSNSTLGQAIQTIWS